MNLVTAVGSLPYFPPNVAWCDSFLLSLLSRYLVVAATAATSASIYGFDCHMNLDSKK